MIDVVYRGGWVMCPLLLCSFVSVMVVVERLVFWGHVHRYKDPLLVHKILSFVGAGQNQEAIHVAEKTKDTVALLLLAGLRHGQESIQNALYMAGRDRIRYMMRYMGVLDTVITLAPLLGILGTVVGIIQSFELLGGMTAQDPRVVISGIAQALVTTATGLVIAVCSLIPYNFFLHRVDESRHDMEKYGTQLEILCVQGGTSESLSR